MHLLTTLLTFGKARDPRPTMNLRLAGPRVILRAAQPADWPAWRTLRDMSRDFLVPWEPEWPLNCLSPGFFNSMLRGQWRDWERGRAYSFLICARPSRRGMKGALLGGIALNDLRRGVAQKATLGYWIGKPHARHGYMTEAASLVCDFAFTTLRLNRLEASCLPNNEPSKCLLRRLGFVEEGFAKSYLRIDGAWRDHILWGKTAP
ncbi:MAG: GNAT family N-acetyltransferase [Bdellovibrionales bacterium]